jgi:hypothetical protein
MSDSVMNRLLQVVRDEKVDMILLCASIARERLEAHGNEPAYKQAAFEIESLLLAAADRVRKGEEFIMRPRKV